jgi:hypothetical protein
LRRAISDLSKRENRAPGRGVAFSYGKRGSAARPAGPARRAAARGAGPVAGLRNRRPRGISEETEEPSRGSQAMTTFDDREAAFENKFAHDEEMKFRAEARRNKLLGLWAAEMLGKTGAEANAYAVEVVKSDFEEAGHEDVVRKVAGDLGSMASAEEIRGKMDELLRVAKDQLMKES